MVSFEYHAGNADEHDRRAQDDRHLEGLQATDQERSDSRHTCCMDARKAARIDPLEEARPRLVVGPGAARNEFDGTADDLDYHYDDNQGNAEPDVNQHDPQAGQGKQVEGSGCRVVSPDLVPLFCQEIGVGHSFRGHDT